MRKILSVIVAVLFAVSANAAWEKEMEAFRKADAQHPSTREQVLFVGSSTFTMWRTMQEDMPEIPLINRGFGGSKVTDVIQNFDTLFSPHNPPHIVIYEGDNDTASGTDPKEVLENYKQLLKMIRAKYPTIPVTVVSVKTCELRRDKMDAVRQFNKLLKEWAEKTENLYFLDTYSVTVNGEDDPIPEYFLKDNLHLNQNGYKAWARKLVKHLKDKH